MTKKLKIFIRLSPIALLLISVAFALVTANKASALDGGQFAPGRIIDDVIFANKDSMSVAQIQAFLDSKIPVCDTDGSEPYAGTTRSIYAANSLSGNVTPFICLNQYYENPDATYAVTHTYINTSGVTVNNVYNYHQNNYYQIAGFNTVYNNNDPAQGISVVRPIYQNLNGVVPTGAKSAAQLIWDVAQMYNINPQVLIVLLQKEQGIVTDDWAWAIQYEKATGYMCPDTAPCNATKAGFYNQIENAAWQFRADIDNIALLDDWGYYGLGWNNIRYSPNAACGTKPVYIENAATAALYKYTPYTPNDAALANLYGSGDGCSAYGNRNFWRLFNDWFGSTLADTYSAQPVWQGVFTDASKAELIGWNANLVSGQSAYAVIVMKNTGNVTWTKSGGLGITDTRMATYPWGKQSSFCPDTWLINCSRPTALVEDSVAPGGYGTFEFPITAPAQPGMYYESFGLVVDGKTTFGNGTMGFWINVSPTTYSAQPVWQGVFTDASKAELIGWNANLVSGQSAYAVIVMKNTGNVTWTKSGGLGITDTRMATYPWGKQSSFCPDTWLINCSRPTALVEDSVAPGGYGTFEFPITAPAQPGMYYESFGLVVDGKTTFGNGTMGFWINVSPTTYSAQPVWQGVFTDASKAELIGWNANLVSGQSAYAVIVMKNTGNVTWTKSGGLGITDTRMATYPWGKQSSFCPDTWLINCSRPTALVEDSVAPGGYGTFEFPITAPAQPGMYYESFGLVVDGKTTFGNGTMGFWISII